MGEKLSSTSGSRKLAGALRRSLEYPRQTRPMVKQEVILANGQADRGSLRYYNRVMLRRPHYQHGIRRGQICCDWPDGVGTPDEVAARVTYTGISWRRRHVSKSLLFECDPVDQPAATDPVERETWCALGIRVDRRIVSTIWDKSLQSERTRLYLPAFPIAE